MAMKVFVLRESAANDNLFKPFPYISFSLQKYTPTHLKEEIFENGGRTDGRRRRSSSLKPLGQSKSNFMWSLLGMGEPRFV